MRTVALSALALALIACRGTGSHEPDPSESPQAQAVPAPLSSAAAAASSDHELEAGPPPESMRGDREVSVDRVPRDAVVWVLEGRFIHPGTAKPPQAPEVRSAGVENARRVTESRVAIEIGDSRMRIVQLGRGFVLPPDAEVRARVDRYGHFAVWEAASYYRPLPPGAMRAFIGERRFDVGPLSSVTATHETLDGEVLTLHRSRRALVTSRVARARLELAKAPEAGTAPQLLCRFFLDLMNAPPSSTVCRADELPVRAEWAWADGGSFRFEGLSWKRKPASAVAARALSAPPPGARFGKGPILTSGVFPLLTRGEMAALRTGPVDVGPLEGDAVLVVNGTEELRTLWIDGVPFAWAAPGARRRMIGFHRGHYVGQWRTFLGDDIGAPFPLTVPGTASIGVESDGGT